VSEEEARAAVGETPLSCSANDERRERFYVYCRQRGRWPQEVAGHDPDGEREWFRPFEPRRNVTAGYPPTLLLHGDEDSDVPYEQSELMAEVLRKAGVSRELYTVAGGEHGFDAAGDEAAEGAFQRVLDFLGEHLR
jgi:dipeptidyl aminopeptidase/acylaminoacyl peptidase